MTIKLVCECCGKRWIENNVAGTINGQVEYSDLCFDCRKRLGRTTRVGFGDYWVEFTEYHPYRKKIVTGECGTCHSFPCEHTLKLFGFAT